MFSQPKKQTQTNPVLSAFILSLVEVVEWANFFKGQNRLPENPATPLSTGVAGKLLQSQWDFDIIRLQVCYKNVEGENSSKNQEDFALYFNYKKLYLIKIAERSEFIDDL